VKPIPVDYSTINIRSYARLAKKLESPSKRKEQLANITLREEGQINDNGF
jgi:hypothetical protein